MLIYSPISDCYDTTIGCFCGVAVGVDIGAYTVIFVGIFFMRVPGGVYHGDAVGVGYCKYK